MTVYISMLRNHRFTPIVIEKIASTNFIDGVKSLSPGD